MQRGKLGGLGFGICDTTAGVDEELSPWQVPL
jgi:hypothetical protein